MIEPERVVHGESVDVFLIYNSAEKSVVRDLARELRSRCVDVWLDEDSLLPGDMWSSHLDAALGRAGALAILVGASGFARWQELEAAAALDEGRGRGARIIPVLLPGAPHDLVLPRFLRAFTWLDLRNGMSRHGLDNLAHAIKYGQGDSVPRESCPRSRVGRVLLGAALVCFVAIFVAWGLINEYAAWRRNQSITRESLGSIHTPYAEEVGSVLPSQNTKFIDRSFALWDYRASAPGMSPNRGDMLVGVQQVVDMLFEGGANIVVVTGHVGQGLGFTVAHIAHLFAERAGYYGDGADRAVLYVASEGLLDSNSQVGGRSVGGSNNTNPGSGLDQLDRLSPGALVVVQYEPGNRGFRKFEVWKRLCETHGQNMIVCVPHQSLISWSARNISGVRVLDMLDYPDDELSLRARVLRGLQIAGLHIEEAGESVGQIADEVARLPMLTSAYQNWRMLVPLSRQIARHSIKRGESTQVGGLGGMEDLLLSMAAEKAVAGYCEWAVDFLADEVFGDLKSRVGKRELDRFIRCVHSDMVSGEQSARACFERAVGDLPSSWSARSAEALFRMVLGAPVFTSRWPLEDDYTPLVGSRLFGGR